MNNGYFNYSAHTAEGWWGRRSFVHAWWAIYANDNRWAPPYYPALGRLLSPGDNEHLERQTPILLHMQAYPGRRDGGVGSFSTAIMESSVGAVVLLVDPRRHDRTAYLGLLHCANDQESLERLLGAAMEQLWPMGCQRMIGPVGLSPFLQSGVLMDHFHVTPPLHTPYNPPYIPEVIGSVMTPLAQSRLFHISVESVPAEMSGTDLCITPVEPVHLVQELLPLFAETCIADGLFPPADGIEIQFLARWLEAWPLYLWIAKAGGTPVGFIIMQPDISTCIVRAKGGRNPFLRWWLAWCSRSQVRAGRLVFGGVLPEWRRRGIGRRLWIYALTVARNMGWRTITVGPVAEHSPAAAFLEAHGAQPRQSYVIYASDL